MYTAPVTSSVRPIILTQLLLMLLGSIAGQPLSGQLPPAAPPTAQPPMAQPPMAQPPMAQPPMAQPPMAPQQASPMAESTRRHERLVERLLPGDTMSVLWGAASPAALYLPREESTALDVVVHFHGAPWLVQQAVAGRKHTAALVLNLGSGSGVYDRSFVDAEAFERLLSSAAQVASRQRGRAITWRRITLSGFSAGHGAIRRILRTVAPERISAVLLLDGMHTSYVPEGTTLASGGVLDTTNLVAFARYGRRAADGKARLLITHSEIFPGTYASTTETADWLLQDTGIRRKPVLKWGPRGMQQISEARRGYLQVRGYAGNSAPDHVDQLHAMPELLRDLWR